MPLTYVIHTTALICVLEISRNRDQLVGGMVVDLVFYDVAYRNSDRGGLGSDFFLWT